MKNTDEENNFIHRNLKRNMLIFIINGCIESLGAGMVPLGTVITYYIAHYTDSSSIVGLINFILPILSNFPQVIFARYLKRFEHIKWVVVINGLITKSMWIILGVATLTINKSIVNLLLFLTLYGFINLGSGLHSLAWNSTAAKVIPAEMRGKFIGIRSFFAGITELLATLLMGLILSRFLFPHNYSVLFLVTGTLSVASVLLIAFIREHASCETEKHTSFQDYFAQLKEIIKSDKAFDWFMVSEYFSILSRTITVFLVVYAKAELDLDAKNMVIMTAVTVISKTGFYLIWGYMNDRYGYKPSLAFSACGFAAANIISLLFLKNMVILAVVFALTGMSQSARNVGRINFTIQLAGEGDVRSYLGLASMILTVPFALFPLILGVAIDNFGFVPFFAINAVSGIAAALIISFKVRE